MRNDPQSETDETQPSPNARQEPRLDLATIELENDAITTPQSNGVGRSSKAIGALSVLLLAVTCSGIAFGSWSLQRMQLLEQQLIATQDSFSKISEDATGRINEITGTVSATHSSVLSDNDSLKKRLDLLEDIRIEGQKQQQLNFVEHAARLTKISSEISALAERQQGFKQDLAQSVKQHTNATEQSQQALTQLQTGIKTGLDSQRDELKNLAAISTSHAQQLTQLDAVATSLSSLKQDLARLQKSSSHNEELTRLQQDIFILRSELERNTSTATHAANTGPSLADFDAYRAQTQRSISALQEQVRALQKNTP